jgi:hypothetical protein
MFFNGGENNVDILRELLTIGADITALFGVPIAILIYYQSKRKERLDREYGTYNALDEKYTAFLELCLQHPDLDVFDIPLENPNLNPEQYRRQIMLYTILVSLFERAYLMYRDHSNAVQRQQFGGWDEYIRDWMVRPSFRKDWEFLTSQFDADFITFMRKIAGETQPKFTT